MKRLFNITTLAYIMLIGAIFLALWYLIWGGYFIGEINHPDPEKAKEIQPFIGGLVLPLLTLGSTLLVIANLRSSTIQNFSSNFFKLIDQHHKLIDNIDTEIEGIDSTGRGREFFDNMAQRIAEDYEDLSRESYREEVELKELLDSNLDQPEKPKYEIDAQLRAIAYGKKEAELLLVIYDHFFHLYMSDLGHYFRNLYHIVRFVERSSISESTKLEFIKMLRAQLSNYEILMLAYNGMHDYGKEFRPLIEKYELLKNLNNERRVPANYVKRIINDEVLTEAYPHLDKHWNKEK